MRQEGRWETADFVELKLAGRTVTTAGVAERGCGKTRRVSISTAQALKRSLISNCLRGAEAPLFHGSASIRDFFRLAPSRRAFNPDGVVFGMAESHTLIRTTNRFSTSVEARP